MKRYLSIVLFIGVVNAKCPTNVFDPEVWISNSSSVRGIRLPGYQTDCYEAFFGIPYAKPPEGDLRFANPQPAEKWQGTLLAQVPKQDCIQKNYLLVVPVVTGVEDCLYLNVYRPMTSKDTLPVMVYFYGGGFFSGSSNPLIHGPEYFMDTKEVILVTVAYRLGALGFLSTGDSHCPGNFGLKDQNLALQWVNQNIRSFGGNPGSVTIFGQSAGGASVHMHMLSPLSTGLFHRAIVMSGNAAAPYNKVIKYPLNQARRQAKYSGIENSHKLQSQDLIKALRAINATTIVEAGDEFKYWHVDSLTTFRTVLEPDVEGAFLVHDPIETVRTGNYTHVPWMTGFVPNEGAVRTLSIISNETLTNSFNENFDYLLTSLLEILDEGKETLHWKLKKIVNYYFNGMHKLTHDTVERFMDMITDRAFLHPLYKTVQSYVSYADLEKNPLYIYKFNYKGPYSYSKFYTGTSKPYGVVHCDELIYLFNSPFLFPDGFNRSSIDASVVGDMVDMFVSFATTGQPVRNSTVKSCNKDAIFNSSNGFCDYIEFRNTAYGGYVVERNSTFDIDAVRFWDKVLN